MRPQAIGYIGGKVRVVGARQPVGQFLAVVTGWDHCGLFLSQRVGRNVRTAARILGDGGPLGHK